MSYSYNLAAEDGSDTRLISEVRKRIKDNTASGESPVKGTDYFLDDDEILSSISSAYSVVSQDWAVIFMACWECLLELAKDMVYLRGVYRGPAEEFDGATEGKQTQSIANDWKKQAEAAQARADSQTCSTNSSYSGPSPSMVSSSISQSVSW